MIGSHCVDSEGNLPELLCQFVTDTSRHDLVGDILIMPGFSLGGRRKDSLRQFVGTLQTLR